MCYDRSASVFTLGQRGNVHGVSYHWLMRSSSSVRMLLWRMKIWGSTLIISPNLCSSNTGSPSSPSASVTADLKSCKREKGKQDLQEFFFFFTKTKVQASKRAEWLEKVLWMKGGREGMPEKWKKWTQGEQWKEGQVLLNILPATLPSNHLSAFPPHWAPSRHSGKATQELHARCFCIMTLVLNDTMLLST